VTYRLSPEEREPRSLESMNEKDQSPGRNDPCWCGSGKKFKRCHWLMQTACRPTRKEVSNLLQTRISFRKKYCLHPRSGSECSGDIVRAHSIQKGGGLSRIARNGEVYCFKEDLGGLYHSPGRIKPQLVGNRLASTFTGFCGFHDRSAFATIETRPFACEPEQVFLLAYRALCSELFHCRHKLEAFSDWRKLLVGLPKAEVQTYEQLLHEEQTMVEIRLKNLEEHKRQSDKSMLERDFSDYMFYVAFTHEIPDILCSALVVPQSDFTGNQMESLNEDNTFRYCAFSIIGCENGGAVIFSGSKDKSPSVLQLIQSFCRIPDSQSPDAIVRFAFEFSNNVCISPSWWERLDVPSKERLIDRAQSGHLTERRKDCLIDDGVKVASWEIVKRQTNMGI
jgi:hypothetical protein